jgi:endonuclease YncB( thermonuclease family)
MSKGWNPRRADRRRDRSGAGGIGAMAAGGILLGLLLAAAPALPFGAGVPAAQAAQTGDPRQVRVIDGDTFDLGGIRIRIADIDTPEVRGRCAYETELAARATARMRSLLYQGDFELHPLADGRDEDRYGRKLRIVTRGGRSLGDMLVAEGLARTWTGRREPWCV